MYRITSTRSKCWALAPALLVLAALVSSAPPARPAQLIWTSGRVIDHSGHPVPNALVAVYDDSNRVADYARTDERGEYALAVPRGALHLEPKRGKGFIAEVFGAVARFAGDTAGFVATPVRAGVHAITTSQASSFADPVTRGGITAGGAVADKALAMLTPRGHRPPPIIEDRKQPGSMLLKVIAPDTNDLVDVGRIYWMQEETLRAGGRQKKTIAAWVDPIQLMPSNSEARSHFQTDSLRFTQVRLEPSVAEVGQRVRIMARLPMPAEPAIHAVVVARNNRTGQKWELEPVGDGRYQGELVVDKKFPADDQEISIIAYAASEQQPGRRPAVERAIEGAGLWDVRRPYRFDPMLLVSRNRAEVTLTVVTPRRRSR